MPTHSLTVELSEEAFTRLQQRLEAGEYSSPAAFIEDAILDSDLPDGPFPPLGGRSPEAWLDAEIIAAFDAFAANPSEVYTPAEVRMHLAAERRQASNTE